MSEDEPLLPDRVARSAEGTIGLRLTPREREILRALLGDLRSLVAAPPLPEDWEGGWPAEDGPEDEPFADEAGGPDATGAEVGRRDAGERRRARGDNPAADDDPDADIRARLYPEAAPDDPRADASYRRLVHADLEAGRRERIAVVEATLEARTIDDAQAGAWLMTLNDLRLVLGTRLKVTEDSEAEEIDPEDPQAAARVVYAYVGWLEAQFVDVLADALPDAGAPGAHGEPPDPDDEAIAADDS